MRMRYAVSILATCLLALAAASPVFAHAKLLSSKPSAGESLSAAPDVVELQFSTRIQQKMSSVDLIDPAGRPIALSLVGASEDGKTLRADLPELEPGSYTVNWRALSADDHMISGDFSFQVGQTSRDAPVSEPSAPALDHSSMDHGVQTAESVQWPQSIIRWLVYLSMMVIGGGLICRRVIPDDAALEPSVAGGSYSPVTSLFVAASAVLVVCLVIALGLQTYSIFNAVGPRQAYSVLSDTDFGLPWLIQFAAAVVVLVLLLLRRSTSEKGGMIWSWGALAAWLFIPLAGSLSGHAKAASAEFGFATVSSWLHMVAAAAWTGGLVLIIVSLPGLIKLFSGKSRYSQLAHVIHNFNRVAIASVALLAVTGIYNTWIHVESLSALVSTLYGRVLLGKIVVTCVIVGLGAMNSFVLRPRMLAEEGLPGDTSNEKLFFRSVRTEAALAAAVLLLAAILAFLPPARKHDPSAALAGPVSVENY